MDIRKEILIPQKKISARVKELAGQISLDYSGKEPIVVGVLNGAVFFFADLVRQITIPSRIDFIRASSYGSESSSSGLVKLNKNLDIPISDKPVIIVEDIVDTGLTLTKIVNLLKDRNPESIKICALINKLERREMEVTIDYCGFQVESGFLVGYGLDYDEKFRCLRDIYTLIL